MNPKKIKEIEEQRRKEYAEHRNMSMEHPTYLVLDPYERWASGHYHDYGLTSTLSDKFSDEEGYIDLAEECEDREFFEYDDCMQDSEEVTRFYVDRLVAIFLTRKGAEDYLKYQSHNMSERAYIYGFGTGYSNWELKELFEGENKGLR